MCCVSKTRSFAERFKKKMDTASFYLYHLANRQRSKMLIYQQNQRHQLKLAAGHGGNGFKFSFFPRLSVEM